MRFDFDCLSLLSSFWVANMAELESDDDDDNDDDEGMSIPEACILWLMAVKISLVLEGNKAVTAAL